MPYGQKQLINFFICEKFKQTLSCRLNFSFFPFHFILLIFSCILFDVFFFKKVFQKNLIKVFVVY